MQDGKYLRAAVVIFWHSG